MLIWYLFGYSFNQVPFTVYLNTASKAQDI